MFTRLPSTGRSHQSSVWKITVILESPVIFNTSGKRIAFIRVRHLLVEIKGLGPCRAAADLNWRILQRISASRAASAGSRLIARTSAVFNQSDAAGSSETFKVCWNQMLGSLRLRISSPMTYRRWWRGLSASGSSASRTMRLIPQFGEREYRAV